MRLHGSSSKCKILKVISVMVLNNANQKKFHLYNIQHRNWKSQSKWLLWNGNAQYFPYAANLGLVAIRDVHHPSKSLKNHRAWCNSLSSNIGNLKASNTILILLIITCILCLYFLPKRWLRSYWSGWKWPISLFLLIRRITRLTGKKFCRKVPQLVTNC